MEIGIIAAHNIRYSPYIFYYTNILDNLKIKYELIYPDKSKLNEEFPQTKNPVEWNNRLPSILNYYFYSSKVKKIIKEKRYDGLIVLTTINVAYLSTYLKKNYNNKYIVDIRDYTHEDKKSFYFLEKIGITHAALRVISSKKFEKFLPINKYFTCHNLSMTNLEKKFKWKKPDKEIIIGHVGSISYKEPCKKLINLIKNDERFEFHIYGNESDEKEIEKLVTSINCDRIKYFGPYTPDDKGKIINSVDILFNTYGNGIPLLDYAVSNKMYDAMYYKKLILTSPNTYMEELGGKIAYSIDYENDRSLDRLYNWIKVLDSNEIQEYQDRMMEKFINENRNTENKVIETIDNWR